MATEARREAGQARAVEAWEDQPRIDAHDKVTGRAKYVEDLPALPGMVYAAALRSPYSHARIISIDASRALALPGVLGVLDREHLGGLDPHAKVEPARHEVGAAGGTADQSWLTTDKARFDGDLLALVAATDLRTARHAVSLIDVEYEVLPPVFSAAEALAPGAPLVHEDRGNNLALEDSLEWGDVERGFAEADRIFEETFDSSTIFHHPMEPASSFVAYATPDEAELWAPTEKPYGIAEPIATLLDIPPEQVRVRVPYVGGGFGAKQFLPVMLAALGLSRLVGRPIKYVATAEESFRANARHAMTYKARIGVKNDGSLVALDVALDVDTGAYLTAGGIATHNACISAWGCYRLPHYRVRARTAYTNKVPAGTFRGTGKTQTTFGVESAMDSVARQMGLDPITFRERNVLRRGEYVTDKWRVRGEEFVADTPPLDTDFGELMARVVEAIHWDGRAGRAGRGSAPNLVRGKGLALSLRHGAQGVGRTYAMATLYRDGSVKVSHNAPDLGTGVYTIIAVIAARTLGIPEHLVRVGDPDTSNDLPFGGTNAQRTTVQMGSAVQAACENLKKEIADAASQAKGGRPEDWRVADGRVWRGEETYTFPEISRAFKGNVMLKGIGSYSSPHTLDQAFGGLDHWSPGAAAAEVEVDTDTGEVRVLQYAAASDAGKTIHHTSAQRQIEGGAIMGLGNALFEEVRYEEGQLMNADPFQYRLPLLRDVPEAFKVDIVEHGDGPGPFGAKGMSQTSIPCTAPAINNAIRDAIGVYLESVPFTPEKILRALGKLSPTEPSDG
ncbi:MAG TPA: xanthine dehydrogenase family protein molybdopterin-binding subunit [Chloroflexota bacterium]|jgi:CO/xanthine dehydrogenase Mo-binding subunit